MRDANARVRVLVKPDVAAECPAEFGSSARGLAMGGGRRFGPPRPSQQVGTYSVGAYQKPEFHHPETQHLQLGILT